MKRLIYKIMCGLAIIAMVACSENDLNETPEVLGGKIVLQVSSDIVVSRAEVNDMKANHEYDLSHLDILIFNSTNGLKVYHERVINPTWGDDDGQGQVTLNATDKVFNTNDTYNVYVVANSSQNVSEFAGLQNLEALKALKEETPNLHLTGLHESIQNVPATFLMDGQAYEGNTEKTNPVSINLQNANVKLSVTLRRAASKVVLTFSPQTGVEFLGYTKNNANPGYYVRNLPTETYVLAEGTPLNSNHAATTETASNYYVYQKSGDAITSATITLYVYSHSWKKDNMYTEGTNLILNLPMKYNDTEYLNNYYQVPLNKPKKDNDNSDYGFDRNMYYSATVKISAPGASSIHTPITVDPLEFSAVPWIEKTINVGGVDGPKYLKVNREDMEMYNVETDATTLKFASSSPVTMTIKDVYFIDKFGQRQNINNISQYNMTATAEANALSGNITVNSDLPTNNTIRYFTIEVTNGDFTRIVTVKQYPLIYITNIQGWYSYRDDFKYDDDSPTTYEYKGDRIVGISLSGNDRNWSYNYNTNVSGYWRSKVVTKTYDNGYSNLAYYYYNSNENKVRTDNYGMQNTRMYHVRVTSSSPTYKVGRPRLNASGYTDGGADNKELVSPSFMIASRLGFINSDAGNIGYANTDEESVNLYNHHCSNYVEVYKDPVTNETIHLRDWRLPTEAELEIIMQLQGDESEDADAIDYLLNATYYISASGPVYNSKNSNSGTAGRCVRDAYPQSTSTTDVE